jgi:hypothetical protein
VTLTYSTLCDGSNISLSLSNDISLVNFANVLKCFLFSLFLLIGQTSVFNIVDINLSLSLFSSSHSNSK